MTQAILTSLIMSVCSQKATQERFAHIFNTDKKEAQILCFDYLTNCAVTNKGIITEKEFNTKCLK